MQYRRYGRTGLKISVITFGAMRIPFNESKVTPDEHRKGEENAVAVMKRAMEAGINHVDTARGYGNSERLVGLGLKELGRDKFYVSTKIGVRGTADEARQRIDEALRKLNTDHIDVVDLHGINTLQGLKECTAKGASADGVKRAIADGVVRHMAFSSHAGPDVIVPTLETGLFDAVSMLYWWTHQRNAISSARAAELDIGVLILSPAEKGGLLFKPTPQLEAVCRPFTPLFLTHRWLLAQKGVVTLTAGAAKPEELEAHLPAGDMQGGLTEEEKAALKRWSDAEHAASRKTYCTICYKCMPCPQKVAIPEILRLRNLGVAFDLIEFGRMRYNLLGEGGDWFPGQKAEKCNRCGECLARCPENLAIPDLLEETDRMLKGEQRKRLWL